MAEVLITSSIENAIALITIENPLFYIFSRIAAMPSPPPPQMVSRP